MRNLLCDPVNKTCFCTSQLNILISLYLMQYEYLKIYFKNVSPHRLECIGNLLCEPVYKIFIRFKSFFIGIMLLYIWIAYGYFIILRAICMYVKICFKNFSPISRNRKNFVSLCRWTFRPMFSIFNAVHSISNMNNIYKFQDVGSIFTRVMGEQTYKQTKCLNTAC